MTEQGMSWLVLAHRMVRRRDPEPTLHGVITSTGAGGEGENLTGWSTVGAALPPVFTGVSAGRPPYRGQPPVQQMRVWRDGTRVRTEHPVGDPQLISDGNRTWTFPHNGAPATVSDDRTVTFRGSGTHLLVRRSVADLLALGEPTTDPAPVTALGRAAWQVTLHPVDHPGTPRELTVDDETGLVLSQHNPTTGGLDEWTELTVGDPLPAELFRYDGPARSAHDAHAANRAEHDADRDYRRTWFTHHVTDAPLRGEVALELTVTWLHTLDNTTGAFEASLEGPRGTGGGSLARRPRSRSPEPWTLSWASVGHRWTTQHWDWAITIDQTNLTTTGLTDLKNQLGDTPHKPTTTEPN